MMVWPFHFIIPSAMVLAGMRMKRLSNHPHHSRAAGMLEGLGLLAGGVTALVDLLALVPAFAGMQTGPVALGVGLAALAAALCLARYDRQTSEVRLTAHSAVRHGCSVSR